MADDMDAPGDPQRSAVGHIWRRQRAWSIGADRAKRIVDQGRAANLLLLVAAAILGALASQSDWISSELRRTGSVAAAALLATAGLLQAKYLTAARVKAWSAARSASETLKAEVFTYLVGVAPYDVDKRDDVLLDRLDAVEERARNFGGSAAEPDGKAPPEIADIEDYRGARTQGQRDWHNRRRHELDRAAGRLRGAQFLFTAVGAILGLIGGIAEGGQDVDAWVAAVAAVGAAIAAHIGAVRYDHIAQTYEATAAQLDNALIRFDVSAQDAPAGQALVVRTEEILARQNDAWIHLVDKAAEAPEGEVKDGEAGTEPAG